MSAPIIRNGGFEMNVPSVGIAFIVAMFVVSFAMSWGTVEHVKNSGIINGFIGTLKVALMFSVSIVTALGGSYFSMELLDYLFDNDLLSGEQLFGFSITLGLLYVMTMLVIAEKRQSRPRKPLGIIEEE
jgi:hypothetical protein